MWKMSFVVTTQREFLPIWVPPISFLGCFCHYLDFWMTIVHIVIVFKIFISSIQVTFTDDLHSIYWPSTALQKSVKPVSSEKTINKNVINDVIIKLYWPFCVGLTFYFYLEARSIGSESVSWHKTVTWQGARSCTVHSYVHICHRLPANKPETRVHELLFWGKLV